VVKSISSKRIAAAAPLMRFFCIGPTRQAAVRTTTICSSSTAGSDRDSGFGIVVAPLAVQYALTQ
jgi:hypothetical protein